jgi:hypothetical protein
MFYTKVVEKTKSYFVFSNFFQKSRRLRDNVKEYDGAREAADGIMAARCMLDSEGYTRACTR